MTYTERLTKLVEKLRYLDQGLWITCKITNNTNGRWELNGKYGNIFTRTAYRDDYSLSHESMAELVYHSLVEDNIIYMALGVEKKAQQDGK